MTYHKNLINNDKQDKRQTKNTNRKRLETSEERIQ